MKARIAFRNFSNDDPGVELSNILVKSVRINRLIGSLLEANRAHVMVVAVIDVRPVCGPQPIHQQIEGLVLVGVVSD